MDGFIRDNSGTKYLVLVSPEKYDAIFDRIINLIGLKSAYHILLLRNILQLKIDLNDDLPLEKALTLYNASILIKSVSNKNYDQYYYKKFLEKCLYQLILGNNNNFF